MSLQPAWHQSSARECWNPTRATSHFKTKPKMPTVSNNLFNWKIVKYHFMFFFSPNVFLWSAQLTITAITEIYAAIMLSPLLLILTSTIDAIRKENCIYKYIHTAFMSNKWLLINKIQKYYINNMCIYNSNVLPLRSSWPYSAQPIKSAEFIPDFSEDSQPTQHVSHLTSQSQGIGYQQSA